MDIRIINVSHSCLPIKTIITISLVTISLNKSSVTYGLYITTTSMRQKLIQLSNINYQNASICSGIRVDVTCREMQQEHIIQTSLKRFSQDSYQRSSSDHRYQTSNLFKWQFFYFTFHTECVWKHYQTLPNITNCPL